MDNGHPVSDDYSLVGMKSWDWFDTLFYIVEWTLIFITFVSNFESQFYYFNFGRNIGSMLSMLIVFFDAVFKVGYIKPTKSWTR